MGSALFDDHTSHHALAGLVRRDMVDLTASHARTLCVLLCRPALLAVVRAQSRTGLEQHADGHRETTVHHGRIHGAAAVDSVSRHIHEWNDATPRQTLEKT